VSSNRLPADEQAFRDLVLTQAVHEKLKDLPLSARQPPGDRRGGLRASDEMPHAREQLVRRVVRADDAQCRDYGATFAK
jgi:hypothetical protein